MTEQKLWIIREKLFSAGEKIDRRKSFMTVYTNVYQKTSYFCCPYSGKIIPSDLSDLGGKGFVRVTSFLAAKGF